MEAMKRTANPENALKTSFDVLTAGAFARCGGVMAYIIAKTRATKQIVILLAVQRSSTAKTATWPR